MHAAADPIVDLGPDAWRDARRSGQLEWLCTNGLGGYACGTVGGLLQRRWHGLLVAATEPPAGRTLLVPNFLPGRRHRASDALTLPGGKGVNIARALRRLGQPVIATGLAGGKLAINWLSRIGPEDAVVALGRDADRAEVVLLFLHPCRRVVGDEQHSSPRRPCHRNSFRRTVDRFVSEPDHTIEVAENDLGGLASRFHSRLLARIPVGDRTDGLAILPCEMPTCTGAPL